MDYLSVDLSLCVSKLFEDMALPKAEENGNAPCFSWIGTRYMFVLVFANCVVERSR